jgi:hypothetical protein
MTITLRWWDDALKSLYDTTAPKTWMHVWGAKQTGKHTFVEWLQDREHGARRIVRLRGDELPRGEEVRPGALLNAVLAGAQMSAVEGQGSHFFPGLLEALKEDRILLIIEGIDDLLVHRGTLEDLATSFLRPDADPEGRLKLVTTSTWSLQAILRVEGRLGSFAAAGFQEVLAGWLGKEGDAPPFEGDSMLAPGAVTAIVEAADGHPGLSSALADAARMTAPNTLAVSAIVRSAWKKLMTNSHQAALLPWLEVDPASSLETRLLITALSHLMPDVLSSRVSVFPRETFGAEEKDAASVELEISVATPVQTADDIAAAESLAVSLGLVHPDRRTGRPPSNAASLDPDQDPRLVSWIAESNFVTDLGSDIAARLRDLQRIFYTLKAEEDRLLQEGDPALNAVLAFVEDTFCNSERGRVLKIEIMPRVTVLIPGVQYSLTLRWRDPDTDPKTTGEDQGFSYSTLRVFRGVRGAFRDLWKREFSILRELSNTEHPAFPDFRQNATMVDKSDTDAAYGYMLTDNEGRPLNAEVISFLRDKRNRVDVLREVKSLMGGLVRLQARAMVHRLISPERLRYRYRGEKLRLTFGGFEIATGAHLASAPDLSEDGPGLRQTPITPRLMQSLFESAAARRFVEPVSQSVFFEAVSPGVDAVMPQGDVYGLCLTLLDTFYGPPDHQAIEDYVAASTDTEAKARLERLLRGYRDRIRRTESPVIAPILRDILLKGIDPDLEARVTAIDLQREILDANDALDDWYSERGRSTFLVTYSSEKMLAELGNHARNSVNINWDRPKTLAGEMEAYLNAKLKGAKYMFLDPHGYRRFLTNSAHATVWHDMAQIVIVCDGISFYCDYARDRYGPNLSSDVLVLRYTLLSRNHATASLVGEDYRCDFPNTRFKLCPDDHPELTSGNLKAMTTDGDIPIDWSTWLANLRPARVDRELEVAVDAISFVAHLTRAERRLIQFPVRVQRSATEDGGWVIVLDAEAFETKVEKDDYLALLWSDVQARRDVFFQASILDWLDRSDSVDQHVWFNPDGTDENVRLPIGPGDVQEGKIRVRQDLLGLRGTGRLVYSDDRGVESLFRRQILAIQRIRDLDRVLRQLNQPHPTLALSRSMPDGFGKGLSGRAPEIIWNMVNAHPLFLLQGPPGTGKTRALTEFCHHVLTNEDVTAKFLISAQSHATVDTTLERLSEAFRREDGTNENFLIIRHVPAFKQERVSQSVRESYVVEPQVERLTRLIGQRADERLQQLGSEASDPVQIGYQPRGGSGEALLRRGLEMLRDVGDKAPEEIELRFRRNASLHFATTSAAGKAKEDLLGAEEKFHTAVVEEAAMGWGPSLLQPLVEAHAAVLIGDHHQIGPFDSARITRLAHLACGGVDETGGRRGRIKTAPLIFGQYQDDPSVMTRWMEPFRRIFVEIKQKRLSEVQGGVKIADMLNKQFRSVEKIGTLVSETFYEGKIEWGEVAFDETRAVIDLEKLASCKGKDRSLVWMDTEDLGAAGLHRRNWNGRIHNAGEINVLKEVLRFGRWKNKAITAPRIAGDPDSPIAERLMILSPYRSQVAAIKDELRKDPARYGFSSIRSLALQQIEDVVGTVDAAQGREADTVIVLMARAVDFEDRAMPEGRDARPEDYAAAIKRNYGFLIEPSRINVMFSRARQQLIVIGHFGFFSSLVDDIEAWAESYGGGTKRAAALSEEQQFWQRIVARMKQDAHHVLPIHQDGKTSFA